MRSIFSALIVGIIFGGGLALSDMINPGRVLAFLDVAGAWDPTLAFVMAGAVIPTAIAFAMRGRLNRPLFANAFVIPENRSMDRRLILGAAIFGIGWGLVGFCPGPAIAGLVLGLWQPWLFVAMMLLGMLIERVLPLRLSSRPIAPRQSVDA
jgi:uncharacterized membrane protein YedE/YeeE